VAMGLIPVSNRNISCGVKAAGAYGWQPYHLHVPMKSGEPQPPGTLRACPDLEWDCFTFIWVIKLDHRICVFGTTTDSCTVWYNNKQQTAALFGTTTNNRQLHCLVQQRTTDSCTVWYNNEQQTAALFVIPDCIRIHTYRQVHLGAVSRIYIMLKFLWKCRVIYEGFKVLA
jgi:hypothetical protein